MSRCVNIRSFSGGTGLVAANTALNMMFMASGVRYCPGRKPSFLAVERSAHLCKNAIQNRFTVENVKGA
jgi:hypothetical protein